MRKLSILSCLICISTSVMAQNLYLTFTATDEATVIDSVTAANRTTQESITLPGNETLVLEMSTGINSIYDQEPGISLFPNPFSGKATMLVYQPVPGKIEICIQNLVGQVIYNTSTFLSQGQHSFNINVNMPGIYFINVKVEGGQYTQKAICTESSLEGIEVTYLSSSVYPIYNNLGTFKSQQNSYGLSYSAEDIIRITGFSGIYSTTISVSPTESGNYEMEFNACTDLNGQTYSVVRIGDQLWMEENLAWLPSVSPSSSGSDSSPYYYVYDYNGTSVNEAKTQDNYTKYGVLYNWDAAQTACPTGWHLPSDEEWKTLEKHLGMSSSETSDMGWRHSGNVGIKMKSASGWNANGNGDNSSGLNAFPGGYRSSYNGFYNLDLRALFWSSSPDGSSSAWFRRLNYDYYGVQRNYYSRRYGFSVRCLQN